MALRRTPLRSRPKRSTTDGQAARDWWLAVVRGRVCVMCGTKHDLEGHHCVPQNFLKREFPNGVVWRELPDGSGEQWVRRGRDDELADGDDYRTLQDILWDWRNGMAICGRCHQRHENAAARIPQSRLPVAVAGFARELNVQHRLADRFYPPNDPIYEGARNVSE